VSVLLTVGPKCTLAASHAARVSHAEYAPRALLRLEEHRQTDGWTDAIPLHYAYTARRLRSNRLSTEAIFQDQSASDLFWPVYATNSARRAYNSPPDPLVLWGKDIPSYTSSHSASPIFQNPQCQDELAIQ